jgi:flagellin
LQTQDSGLKTIAKMVDRMSELKALYTNETADDQKDNYETEFNVLGDEIANMSNDTMNGVDIFNSASISVFVSDELSDAVDFGEADVAGEEIGDFTISGTTLVTISASIDAIAEMRAENGAKQSVLGFYSEINSATKTNYEAAVSRIMDVDVAEESTQLARWNTLVQAGTAMLAQANGTTQNALTLLR